VEPVPDRAGADVVFNARIGEFIAAINAHDEAGLHALVPDAATWTQLEELLSPSKVRLHASDPQKGASQIANGQATVDFKTTLSWTNSVRRAKDATASCRATAVYRSGAWVLVGIRVLNALE
jgi:hypothetical protein